jgi:peptidoglycan/LPS O-acetylase OafA/YrhL
MSFTPTDLFHRGLRGLLVGIALFALVGTIAAVWENPFFVRMTPIGPWELVATALMAFFGGVTAALWVPHCRLAGTSGGGLASFLGIACPTCNKVLMLIFGGQALLTWFDPLRPYLATLGVAFMGYAAYRSWRSFRAWRNDPPKEESTLMPAGNEIA